MRKKSSTKKSLNSDKSYYNAKMMMMRIGHLKLSNNSTMKITEETEMGLGQAKSTIKLSNLHLIATQSIFSRVKN